MRFPTFEVAFLWVFIAALWVLIIVSKFPLQTKFVPILLALLLTYLSERYIRLMKDLERPTPTLFDFSKELPLGWIEASLEEILNDTRFLELNVPSLLVYLRNVRYNLSPNWYCAFCGKQVRWAFKPIGDSWSNSRVRGWLSPTRTTCLDCLPLFEGELEEEVDAFE